MKKLVLFFLSLVSFSLSAQILPFFDYNKNLKVFYHGQPRQLEYQPIANYQLGDHILAYVDSKGDLRAYDGQNVATVTNMNVDYKVSDTYLAYRISNGFFIYDNGRSKDYTMYAGDYEVRDSLILFEDTQLNSWNVYYKGQVRTLVQSTGDVVKPEFIGDDIVAYRDNGNYYRIFWKGRIFDFDVWMDPIEFSCGTDIACFNDPTMNTFAVFENGEFKNVEDQFVQSYKAGKDFIVYKDVTGNLMYYSNGDKEQLSSFADDYQVQDNVVLFFENNYTYTYYQGKKTLVCNYIPKDYKIKNDVIAFRNLMGGVSAFVNGRTFEITTQPNVKYTISGDYVIANLFNFSYAILADGRIYNF